MSGELPDRAAAHVVVAIGSALLALAPAVARGGEPSGPVFALRWRQGPGAAACLDADAAARAIEARVGRPVFVAESPEALVIDASITARETGDGWDARVALVRADGTRFGLREMQGGTTSCRDLGETLVIVIALLVDQDGGGGAEAVEAPSAARAPPPARAAARPAPPEPLAARRRLTTPRRSWAFWADASGGLAVGILPRIVPGASLGLGVEAPWGWTAEASAAAWAPATVERAAGSATVTAQLGGLALCPVTLGQRRLRARVCGVGRAGVVVARGHGFDRSMVGREALVDVGVQGTLTLAVAGPVRARLTGSLAAPIVRPRFVVRQPDGNETLVFSPATPMGEAGLGVEVSFP